MSNRPVNLKDVAAKAGVKPDLLSLKQQLL